MESFIAQQKVWKTSEAPDIGKMIDETLDYAVVSGGGGDPLSILMFQFKTSASTKPFACNATKCTILGYTIVSLHCLSPYIAPKQSLFPPMTSGDLALRASGVRRQVGTDPLCQLAEWTSI
ncbi:unnamed protein product [Nippostrongylus brasiliensis]|uniref:Uncharacterized protein n=1 Tax=Nippostrongylus brasiliensis TaxID=27835 RepID=A0A0N4XII0_NIPBR|nr:unnamed protein product [Nippostrongylus brasiliensis]